ncbi:RNA-binding protein [Mesorhizobium silamurunense]|uniref:RNA-binding protein n=1 Tax=Mesorhizobium silamurunense TaxID=499528 RepID=UPI0028ABF77C|nr:RNA-binding protein [Mesorhizobium silamurunense]
MAEFNRINPGNAEATRAILRRMPQIVFLSSVEDAELAALLYLIREKNVPFQVVSEKIQPYRASRWVLKPPMLYDHLHGQEP